MQLVFMSLCQLEVGKISVNLNLIGRWFQKIKFTDVLFSLVRLNGHHELLF